MAPAPVLMITGMRATTGASDGIRAIPLDRIAYTIPETARLLGIGASKVYMLIRDGDLTSFKIGKARRILGSEIEDYARRSADVRQQAS